MAAIGKIRSWGPTLALVIGLALFAFIAEEMFRSCQSQSNERRQQVGEVLGEKINVQEFQSLVDEYQQVIKMTQGRENLTDEELNQVKDQVWSSFVNNKIIEAEAKKLGLTVTDQELQNILREGTNPMLLQTPFVNQQTNRFDVTALTKFLNDYKSNQNNPAVAEQYKSIYDYWKFIEKNLRQQTLAMKYQALLGNSLISNPISAKAAFQGQNEESSILLASIPYTSISDKEVEVSDADLKAKYDSQKEMFKQTIETRDIKYVTYQVIASDNDRKALVQSITEAKNKLESGATPSEIVRKAQSQIAYTGIPATKKAFSADIAAKIDSMAIGQVVGPFETTADNTLNVVKLINKQQLPDSVEFRMIQVAAATEEEAATRADSITNAIKAGADFEELAKKYGQQGTKQWIASNQYEGSTSIDGDSKTYLLTLNTLGAGEVKNLKFSTGNIVLQVTDRRAMTTKYDVAVIKHAIDFSKQTYSDAYNKFSQYVSENKTLEQLEKNASKFGFVVRERKDMTNAEHNVVNLRSTREAMKWVFDAKPGDVSPLYECGNNDQLLVIALTKVHPVGYRELDAVREMLTPQVMRDKKFDMLQKKLEGVKSVADAQKQGAKVDSVNQITFSAPVFVQATGASEPALSGAVATVKQGEFSPRVVKGNGGAYLFQVLKKAEREGVKYDEKTAEKQLEMQAQQAASRYMQELYMKSNVKDNRYLFF